VQDVEFEPGFKRNLLSLVVLEEKGIRYSYVGGNERHLGSRCGTEIAEVTSDGDVLIFRGELSGALANAVMVHSVVQNQEHAGEAVHKDTLYKLAHAFWALAVRCNRSLCCQTRIGHQTHR
jgi:hypothetical protein